MSHTLSVIIPCHNEKEHICKMVDRVLSEKTDKEIIIVDDGSTDGSSNIIRENIERRVAKVIYLPECSGKGNAVRQGIKHATGDFLIIQDADLEYDPNDYQKLLKALTDNNADIAYGSRFVQGKPKNILPASYMGNKAVTMLTNLFTGMSLTDMETCYKMFRTSVVQSFDLSSNTFTIEVELTFSAARHGCKITEVPISYYPRDYKKGKKIRSKDFFIAVGFILNQAVKLKKHKANG